MKLNKSIICAYITQLVIYIKRPLSLFDSWASLGRLNWMPDKWYLSLMFRSRMGYWMSWKNPKTYNEKLQWLKIHNRNPLYTKLVDKYEVRNYVAKKIGEKYLIPLLGVWETPDEINFDKLPERFVLKCTHDSGSVIICKNKATFDIESAKNKLKTKLSKNYYYYAREFPYKNVKPRIIAEIYMEDSNELQGEAMPLTDYKFFCFNGIPKFMYISHDKSNYPTTDFFDMNFNHLEMRMKDPNSKAVPTKPSRFEEMKSLATKLAKGIPHVRVDFYSSNDKIYFGEMTFYHNAGFFFVTPKQQSITIGSLIH